MLWILALAFVMLAVGGYIIYREGRKSRNDMVEFHKLQNDINKLQRQMIEHMDKKVLLLSEQHGLVYHEGEVYELTEEVPERTDGREGSTPAGGDN